LQPLQAIAAVGVDARMVRFLLQLAGRQASLGYSGLHLRLRMSRRDIASHLGIAHESVSRSLSAFRRRGYIRVNRCEVEIVDFAGLHDLQNATRRAREAARCTKSPAASPPAAVHQTAMRRLASLDHVMHSLACRH